MTISRAQMYRQLYQVGGMSGMGIESLSPMQPAMQPAMQSAMYTPLENTYYSGMPMMANGGRMGYQEGDIAMSQPEGIMGAMSGAMQPETGGMMQPPMQGQLGEGDNALLTIIQLLIEQGVPPEQAQELARQILQIFAQGGEPAVEAFANQLEQEEMMSGDRTIMAGGGITGIYPRQGYFLGSIGKAISGAVKGVGKAIKSVAKSPIGRIALTIGATMLMGPAGFNLAAGQFGVTNAFLAGAINAGAANLLVQGITTGKINPKEALLASALGGATGYLSSGTTGATAGTLNAGGAGIPGSDVLVSGVEQGLTPVTSLPVDSSLAGQVPPGSMVYNPPTTAAGTFPSLGYEVSPTSPVINIGASQPSPFESGITSLKNFGTNLMTDPLKTIQTGMGSLYDKVADNIVPLGLGYAAGAGIRPQDPNESDEDYQRYLANRNAEVAKYEDLYRGYLNPPTPIALAADGGQITNRQNYFFGSKVSAVATPQSGGGTVGGGFMGGMLAKLIQRNSQLFKPQGTTSYENRYSDLIRGDFIDQNRNGIDDRQEASYGGRIGYEYGSMPMGEPRRNPAGIMELDYRAKGGFVPPVGIKEKADDIPAMLSNNEFVFTADAVRNAGEGNVNKGAQRMYGLMKQLEAGGIV